MMRELASLERSSLQISQREPKSLKLERDQSGSKISFDDTLELEPDFNRPLNLLAGRGGEPDSSEEDSELDNR